MLYRWRVFQMICVLEWYHMEPLVVSLHMSGLRTSLILLYKIKPLIYLKIATEMDPLVSYFFNELDFFLTYYIFSHWTLSQVHSTY